VILPPSCHFRVGLTDLRVTDLQGMGYVSRLAKHSIYYRKGQQCVTPNRLFVRLTVSAVDDPKVTQISLDERYRTLSGDIPTAYGMCFPIELCIPSYSGRSSGVPFVRNFFLYNFTLLPLQGFEVTHPDFRDFDDAENMVARCFPPLSAKR